jgi:predicted acyl esterase
VSTTGTDADFVVKLVDAYPQDFTDPEPNPSGVHMGYQQLVRAEIMRGKFRVTASRSRRALRARQSRCSCTSRCPTWRTRSAPGHRILVQVQSSWFPLADRNPQTFTDIYKATESGFPHRHASHLPHDGPKPSSLDVTLVRGALPR